MLGKRGKNIFLVVVHNDIYKTSRLLGFREMLSARPCGKKKAKTGSPGRRPFCPSRNSPRVLRVIVGIVLKFFVKHRPNGHVRIVIIFVLCLLLL